MGITTSVETRRRVKLEEEEEANPGQIAHMELIAQVSRDVSRGKLTLRPKQRS
jgi:hypothetical protein